MRITLATETFVPQINGVSRTLLQLVKFLEGRGDEVQLIHPDYGQPPRSPNDYLARAIPAPFYRELLVPIPPFGKVARAIDAFKPDIVHVATEATLGLAVLRHTRRRKIPLVSSFHTNFDQYSSHYRVGFASGLIWRYLRWFHNATSETYVPSRATIADIERRGFERLVLWPRGVDGDLFRPDRPNREAIRERLGVKPDQPLVAYVGRIAPEKNLDYLAEALAEVRSARPEARFLFVGDGPSRTDAEVRIGPNAHFVGYRTGGDLADHYAAADLFAFASLTETFGNVVLEAMSSGLPVVAVRAGGPGDIVQSGETGLLVEPTEPPSAFAAALVSLIDEPAQRQGVARRARVYAQGQTWEEIMGRLRVRYEEVAARAAAAPALI